MPRDYKGKKGGGSSWSKKSNRRPRRSKFASRATADRVQAQGVGKTVSKAFANGNSRADYRRCWDAFHSSHLSLPRAVGPYTIVRTTTSITTNAAMNVFGTFRVNTNAGTEWCDVCGVSSVNAALPINASSNTNAYAVPIPGAYGAAAGSGLTCVPSALSVQIMNGNALQTTSGIVYAAVCPAQLALGGRAGNWNAFESEIVSYMKPRLLSAGKLALRGVQMNSYPLSMSQVSEFTGATQLDSGSLSWLGEAAASGRDSITPMGWAPIAVVNPTQLSLTYLVTIEWRVRFDISNPAVSSHSHHPVTSDAQWGSMIKSAVSLGNGVMDIVENVATMGQRAGGIARAIGY